MNIRRIAWIFGLLTLLMGGGAVGFRLLSGAPWIDCLYMAVITITTVGFEEVIRLDTAGRVFVMIYLCCGFGVFTYAAAQLGESLMNARLRARLERRRMQRRVNAMREHFIICGAGRMGGEIAAYLHQRRKPFVVVDDEQETATRVCDAKGWPYIVGDATQDEVLRDAGILRAASLATALPTDADNLFVTLSARLLNAELQIVARASDERAVQKLEQAGANRVISPFSTGAIKMARFMLTPSIEDFLEIADGHGSALELADFTITDDSPLVGKSLREARLAEKGVMILGVRRATGERLMPPDASVKLERGDCVFAFGNVAALSSVLDENEGDAP